MTAYNGEDENLMADRRPTLDPQERNHQAREFLTRLAIDLDRDGNPNDARACEAIVDDILLPAYRPAAVSSSDPHQKALEAALQFNRIVDQVEARCMAVDGPVTPTLQEISEQELSDLWHAVQTIRAALPPSPAVVPSGWKLVPVDPTEAMIKAGFGPFLAAHDPFFNKNEPTAPIYRAMLSASPSPPALDGAGRDAVIEECAKVADDRTPSKFGGPLASHVTGRAIAAAIRSIKETP